jgi:hypothetical protein
LGMSSPPDTGILLCASRQSRRNGARGKNLA